MIEDLIREGQLIKTRPDLKKAEKSIILAENKIEKAKVELGVEIYDNAVVSAYTAMFHTARALLFKDGFKERNHYVVCEYLRERYRNTVEMKYINELNVLRTTRHKIIYGDDETNIKEIQRAEAESAIKTAEGFLVFIRKLIKQ
ncbi:HEPN domain-containing protein [Candidatus Micrarchaeota archaeon]|nr:HEPN domain-containing protein [Candidatus Micrarchaeota archaeon]